MEFRPFSKKDRKVVLKKRFKSTLGSIKECKLTIDWVKNNK
jgi:hypothetical protein